MSYDENDTAIREALEQKQCFRRTVTHLFESPSLKAFFFRFRSIIFNQELPTGIDHLDWEAGI